MSRALTPGHGPPLRGVLLTYADSAVDLILVTHRAVMGQLSVHRLAADLLGIGSRERYPRTPAQRAPGSGPPAQAVAPGRAAGTSPPSWGLGDRRAGGRFAMHRSSLSGAPGGDPATWLAALSVVVARYTSSGPGYGDEPVTVAAAVPGADSPGDGTAPAQVLVPVRSDVDVTLGELTSGIRAQLASAPGSPAPGASPAAGEPVAGLLFPLPVGGLFGRAAAAVEYIPCLAPAFPLTISVTRDAGDVISLCCYYRLRDFAPAVAGQFARHLAQVYRQAAGTPELAVAAASLFDQREHNRVLALGRPHPPLRTRTARIHDLFAECAGARPDAAALSYGRQHLSYGELDAWSTRLASGLRALGVGDGDRVGVCLERSAALVAALLAVLKAGAVYVPMDPEYPDDRLAYTAEDASLKYVIGVPGRFPAVTGVRVTTPADLADLSTSGPAAPRVSKVTAMHPAYVIYTSGSTGRPKGVVVPHANVAALVDATRADYGLGPGETWTLFHSSAFDFSVWEIWGCLLTGGHLVVVPRWVARSPGEFRNLLVSEKVTILSQTPSAFAQFVEADRREPMDLPIRLIVLGGEPLDTRMLLPWFDRHPESGCRVVNMFGITETTVHVTAQTVTRRHALEASRSVGPPLHGWQVYLLDTAQRLVPPGVTGEIYVGGAGVALGYLNRPELTRERFVPDPFAGGRMYRSGDKGRLRADGALEHLGRIDNQVKVRGFRIELDEIRSVLLEQPAVVAAAVALHHRDPADAAAARIDAYVVLREGSAAEVRRRAARFLPDYMIPATVTELGALPLTTNGKLDVSRLPAQDVPADAETALPAGGFVQDLLATWEKVLGVTAGLDDDFFDLGGNSLFAVRVAAGMRDRGWPPLPVRDIYRSPTIRRLADSAGHPA
jgi:amino acid adenylation domain-containing protein